MPRRTLIAIATATVCALACSAVMFTAAARQGGTTRYVYDENGRLSAVILPSGEANIYEYDAAGNVVSVTRRAATVTTILGFNPQSAPAGAQVTIFGTAFSPDASANAVSFNGAAASVVSAAINELVAVVPAGATDGPITVAAPAGTATSTAHFRVARTPVITGFTPNVGAQGVSVNIAGRNFRSYLPENEVRFGGLRAELTASSETSLTALAPFGAKTSKVSVTTPVGETISDEYFFVPQHGYSPGDVEVTGTLAFGASKRVQIGTPQKIALLAFEGASGQRMRLRLSEVTLPSCTVSVFDRDGVTLLSVRPDENGMFTDERVLPRSETYTVRVVPDGNMTGGITLSLYDESGVGTIAPGGPPVNATVAPPARDTHVTFAAAEGLGVSLSLSNAVFATGTIYLYMPGGPLLTKLDFEGGAGFVDARQLPSAGTYTIFVEPRPAAAGDVTLTLHDVRDVVGSLALGGPQSSFTTSVPGQNLRLTFNAEAGEVPVLNFSGVTLGGDSLVSLYAPGGDEPLFTPAPVGPAGGDLQLGELPSAGTYRLQVNPQGPITGSMTLALAAQPDVTGTLAIDGPPLTVPVSVAGQRARVTFEAAAGQRVSLRLSEVTIPSSEVSILRPDGTPLIPAVQVGTEGRTLDAIAIPAAGVYTVKVDPSGRATGSVTLSLSAATGGITPGGGPVTVSVPSPGGSAQLTFRGVAARSVSVVMSDPTFDGPATLVIKNPDGTTLGREWGVSEYFIDAQTLPATGTYTVTVTADEGVSGGVTLMLYDATEMTGTLSPGSVANLSFVTPGQNARLTFAGTAGRPISVNVTGSAIPRASVTLVAPDGTLLGSDDAVTLCGEVECPGQAFIGPLTLPTTGAYVVTVDPMGHHTGSLSLGVHEVPPDLTGTIAPDGPAAQVAVNTPGQNARLTFEAEAGRRFYVKVNEFTFEWFSLAYLNPDGTRGREMSFGRNFVTQIFESDFLPAGGTQTLLIDPLRGTTGTVSLNLYGVPDDVTASITPGGPPASVATTAVAQNARVTFDGVAGQRVSVSVNNVTIPLAQVSLLRPDGAPLAGPSHLGGGLFIDAVTLPVAGRYTILIDPEREHTGGATVALNDAADVHGTIEVNGPAVTVNTASPGQRAILTFNAAAGRWLRAEIVSTTVPRPDSSENPVTVSLFAPDGSSLLSFGAGAADAPPLPAAGTYRLVVDPNGAGTGATTLRLSEVAPAGTISVDGPQVTVSTRNNRTSRLTFSGAAGQRVSMKARTAARVRASIYGPDSALVGQVTGGDLFSPDMMLEPVTLPGAGTYALAFTQIPSSDGFGSVEVTLHNVADVAGAINLDGPALPVNISTYGQNARLTFQGAAGQRLLLDFTDVTVDLSFVSVVSPDGSRLTDSLLFLTPPGMFVELPTLPQAGTYVIFIDPDSTNRGGMSVRLSTAPSDHSAPVTVNGPPAAFTAARGQNAEFAFDGAAGQQVTVNVGVSDSTDCVEVMLLAPDGEIVAAAYECAGGAIQLSAAALPAAGRYVVRIDPVRANAPTFNVGVTSP